MEPNVGFGGTDKLKRAINMGLAYKSIWMSLIGELKMRPSAGGGSSRDLTFAAERYFPTLDYGQFGVRGALGFGLGGGDYRQMSMGASYRINKIAFDYAFLLPVGAIKGESGSHRVSLTYHFGAPTSDEEIGRDLLEHAKRLRDRGPDYGYEYSEELKPQDLNDPRLADVRRLIEERRYRLAKKALTTFAERQPLSQSLIRLSNRLELVAYYYQDLPAPKSKFDTSLVGALRRFFYSQDRLAMLQASYAYSQKPEDARLGKLLEDMEKAVGIKPTQLDPHSPRGFMDELLYQVEFAHTRGDMSRVETLLSDILELEPDNATALERLGSMRYLTGRLPEAIAAWESAVKIETRQHELESLREYLRLAKERASGKPLPGGASSTAPALIEVPATPTPIVPPVVTVPSPETQAAARPAPATKPTAGDVRDVEKLYLKGVEHYARGEYLQASAMFLRILQIDPNNAQARKALDRINQLRPKR
jgi:tetratricopeptide (TPR) repeat protein